MNKRHLEKLKEEWWNNAAYKSKCEKSEDQSDGISIQNIGGVFIVIFVGIGMACITLIVEYWWYKFRKQPKVIDVSEAPTGHKSKHTNKMDGNSMLDKSTFNKDSNKNTTLRPRNQLGFSSNKTKF